MKEPKTLGEKLQSIPRQVLYLALVLFASVPLFFKIIIPVNPRPSVVELYIALNKLPTDKPVIIESDWTNSTRGENAGHFEAAVRILMRRKIKFIIYSASDAQGPQVYRNYIARIAEQYKKETGEDFKKWENWIDLGFFPNLEGMANSMANDLGKAWGDRRDMDPAGNRRPIFESPVLKGLKKVEDASMLLVITGTSSLDTLVERLGGKIQMTCMCTGVMGPQAQPYYAAKQLTGLAIGLRGVYDMEYVMENGVNVPVEGKQPLVEYTKDRSLVIPPSKGTNLDRAGKYFPTLHSALFLMIMAVILGNVGMYLTKKAGAK